MKKSLGELGLLWKKSVAWDAMTKRQKLIAIWFSLSFVLVGICGNSAWWIVTLVLANFAAAAYNTVKYVPMEWED